VGGEVHKGNSWYNSRNFGRRCKKGNCNSKYSKYNRQNRQNRHNRHNRHKPHRKIKAVVEQKIIGQQCVHRYE
jgi:hypothetical protein